MSGLRAGRAAPALPPPAGPKRGHPLDPDASARQRAGLRAPPERRGGVDRLTVEEELRFLDQAYTRDGRTGLMLQTLLETGARASELVQLRIEDISLVERVVTIRQGKGGKRREVPIRRDLAQLLRLHIGTRRAGPLFASRQEGSGPTPHVLTRQRVGQIVRSVAVATGISKRVYPHLPRCCMEPALVVGERAGTHMGKPIHLPGTFALPFKYHAKHRHRVPKARYRVTNWAEYDASLRQRGSLTVWLGRKAHPCENVR